ncbi:MAG: glutamate--tRNA ligase, partial [Eudoraea sp.]|nr:glutamate--tRNA ligase [Eudoraea sp.]
EFAHLPLIMKPTGKGKLSKRDGEKMGFPVFPLSWDTSAGYREAGYYPEAVINFLALLGWNPGTEQELFQLPELINSFSLDRVHKGGARFDPEKTKWYNHYYLQQQNEDLLTDRFVQELSEIAKKAPLDLSIEHGRVKKIVQLIKERASFENEFWSLSDFLFTAPTSYDEKAIKKQWKEDTAGILAQLPTVLDNISDFNAANISSTVKEWITENELSFGKVMPPLRLVVVGALKGPDLFEILALLGKVESIRRIKNAIASISN